MSFSPAPPPKREQRAWAKGVGVRVGHAVKNASPPRPCGHSNILLGVWSGKKRRPPAPESVLYNTQPRDPASRCPKSWLSGRGEGAPTTGKAPWLGRARSFGFHLPGTETRGSRRPRCARPGSPRRGAPGADPHPPKPWNKTQQTVKAPDSRRKGAEDLWSPEYPTL